MEKPAVRRRAGIARYASGIAAAITMSAGCMALVIAAVVIVPAAMPLVWIGVPIATFCGMLVVYRRFPADTYVIGLVFVPVVAALLCLAALQVSWTIGGNAL
jgi:hypothetical protein